MIISEWFDEDDMALADIQHDEYWHALKILVQCLECQVDNFAPELLPFLPINRFDHRDLQWLHDLLAACFRLTWLRKHPDFTKQNSLFGEGEVIEAREFAFEWHNAIKEQLDALLVSYPNTVRYILISVLWPNPDNRGIGAEEAFFRYVIEPERMRLKTESI